MKVRGKNYRSVWMEGKLVKLINQPELPHTFSIKTCRNYRETGLAIKHMLVRGAPAIGATAGYALAQAVLASKARTMHQLLSDVGKAKRFIESTRPTAFDLFYATRRIEQAVSGCGDIQQAKKVAVSEAQAIADENVSACKKIGDYGNALIPEKAGILTHCNAGALATVDWGTALAPIRAASYSGKSIFVFVDETRPRLQGARLTAWELMQEGINHAILADNAAGHYINRGEIDLCIVGADRVVSNGDFANKIGTYEKAVLAKENGIPFYVAAPLSTFDFSRKTGAQIPIEERDEREVLYVTGMSGRNLVKARIAPARSKALNPAFDVTPANYVSAFITEEGVFKPSQIRKLIFRKRRVKQ
ncbi:MAG: S-methyl-5-thioribose-1-phosphate isomerase [Candidatus Diapherotrites archaeon]|nr:S-methyl-5-thioribose-1-phosphate isomerase [Candidatus Diapherotrites archaeon]